MQKDFIFLLIVWSSPFTSGNTMNYRQFLLGCQAVIPCQLYRNESDSFRWHYWKDGHVNSIVIFFQDKTGLTHYKELLRPRLRILRDQTLVINNLSEEDLGIYRCENCFQNNCWNIDTTVTSVNEEILKGTNKTIFVRAGDSFTHSCPSTLTNLKWEFEAMTALVGSAEGPESLFVESNKSIHIVNVKRANAGKYTCWTSGCDGQRHNLLSIKLCVITVQYSEDSSISCDLLCDMEIGNIKPSSALNVEPDTRTGHADSYRLGNCIIKRVLDGSSVINRTHGLSTALNRTTGVTTDPKYWSPLICGISASLICLLLITLFICCLSPRLRAAFPIHLGCCGLNGKHEEEISVVYSSLVIRRPVKTTNDYMEYSDCVYSELNV